MLYIRSVFLFVGYKIYGLIVSWYIKEELILMISFICLVYLKNKLSK